MSLPRLDMSAFFITVMLFGTGVVLGQAPSTGSGQAFPSRPIRVITSQAGGGADLAARIIAQRVSTFFGQPMIVDNRGAGINGSDAVAKAPPDGYTLLFNGSALWLAPFLQANLPFDPVRDFSPVTLAVSIPDIVVVHPSLPVKSIKELIALAKAKPGELNSASGPIGTTPHLAGELFKAMAGVKFVHVGYKGGGSGLTDLISGQVQLMFPLVSAGMPYVKSGRMRALAVTSAQPSALAPGLPTVAAMLPGYEAVTLFGVFAPAKTPAAVVNRLNQDIARVLNAPDIKEQFLNSGVETVGSTPEKLAATVKSEMAKWSKVIKDAGIRAE